MLFIYCLLLLSFSVVVKCLILALLCILSALSSFHNYLTEQERAGCFTLIVLLLSYFCTCSMSLLYGT